MNDIKDIIEEVKSRCDIVHIISQYISIKQSGTNFKGLCPFHGEKTPSFYVSTSKQMYKCFGCGEGGDVIKFVMSMENLEFMDALKLLAKQCGVDVNTNMNEETKLKMEKINKFQNVHREAARYYFSNLITSKNPGYNYLRNRGLDDKIIKKFGLGYSLKSWDSLKNYLLSRGYTNEELSECGLITYKKENNKSYDKFRNRVMFPIFDYRGNVIGFGGRVLDDSEPKYLNSPDTLIFNKRFNLYGLNFSRKEIIDKTIILVEGYMDLISLYQYGIKNVVATLGTALTDQQGMLIKRYADSAIISYDSDDAGIKATLRAIDILTKLDINVKILNLKDCKDPDEFIRKYGLDEFKKAINLSTNHVKFKIDNLKNNFDLNKGEDRVKFAKEASIIIKGIKSPVEVDYYTKYLSSLIDISVESIKREVYGKSYKKYKNNSFNKYKNREDKIIEKPKIIENGKKYVEENLIKIMLESSSLRENIFLKISEDDFLLNDSREILKFMIKNRELDKITIDKIKSLNISEEYITDLKSIPLENIDLNNLKNIDEIIKNIKKNNINENINRLLEEQKILEDNKTNNDLKEVDGKIMEIALNIVKLRKDLQNL